MERIVKYEGSDRHLGHACERYALYRYFELGSKPRIEVSVDLHDVDADRIIQWLAERL